MDAKRVPGFDAKYSVTASGQVFNHATNSLMKQTVDAYGYKVVKLSSRGVSRQWKIHRLVAQAFIRDFSDDLTVNHKDFDRAHNSVDNLEMASQVENVRYSARKLTIEKAENIRHLHGSGLSANYIADLYCITASMVHKVVKQRAWAA